MAEVKTTNSQKAIYFLAGAIALLAVGMIMLAKVGSSGTSPLYDSDAPGFAEIHYGCAKGETAYIEIDGVFCRP